MHILYIVTRGDVIGGASMHVLELASDMQRRGHQVTILLGPGEVVAQQAAQRRLTVFIEPLLLRNISPISDLRCLLRLRKTIAHLKPDLLHLHSAKAGLLGRLVAKMLAVPVVYSVHGWAFSVSRGWQARCFALLERWLLPWTDLLVLVCQRDLALAEQLAGKHQVRLALVHNGIDDNELQAAPGAQAPVRLCCVARFEAPKDPFTLLSAVARLAPGSWQLTMVGSGPLLAQCQAQAQALGLTQVQFTGERYDVEQLLQQADLFVLSSLSESLPVSVLEAMRASLPVVASNVGGMAELVEEGVSGYLVPAGDIAALAERLQRFIANPALCQQMGQAARQRFCQKFTLRLHGEKISRLYAELVGVS